MAKRNQWHGQPRRHARAARKGWRRRKRRRRRNQWHGQPRRHSRAAKKGWRRRKRRRSNPYVYNQPRRRTRARRRRRNPVLPYFAYNQRRRRRRRRNPVWRSRRTGRYKGRPPGRRLRKTRKGGWRNNPVLPYFAYNQGPVEGILGRAQSVVDVKFVTETAIPLVGGFVGSKMLGAVVYGPIQKATGVTGVADDVLRFGTNLLGASGLAWVVGYVTKDRKMADNVFLGGIVSIFHDLLSKLLAGTDIGRAIGMGENELSEELKHRISESVRSEVERGTAGMDAFVNAQSLEQANPYLGPGQRVQGMGDFATQQAIQAGPHTPQAAAAEVETVVDEAADAMMV